MRFISEVTIRIRKDMLATVVSKIYESKCELQKSLHSDNELGKGVYILEIVYSQEDFFKDFSKKLRSMSGVEILSIRNLIDEIMNHGFISVIPTVQFENEFDVDINMLGVIEVISRNILQNNEELYIANKRNVAFVTAMKLSAQSQNIEKENLYIEYAKLERDAAILTRFSEFNPFPTILKYNHLDDLIQTFERLDNSYKLFRLSVKEDITPAFFRRMVDKISVPVISHEIDERPLLYMIYIIKILMVYKINPVETTVGIVGLNATSIRLTELLKKIGCLRILGFNYNDSMMLPFENSGGMVTSSGNVFSNADIVILIDKKTDLELLKNIRPGQFYISEIIDDVAKEIVLEQGAREYLKLKESYFLTLIPGLVNGVMSGGSLNDVKIINIAKKIVKKMENFDDFPSFFSDIHDDIVEIF